VPVGRRRPPVGDAAVAIAIVASAACARTAASISRAVVTRVVRAPAAARAASPEDEIDLAPRASASRASSIPCVPLAAFERNRTGSIGSRVGPA